jgi:hypothetical protein
MKKMGHPIPLVRNAQSLMSIWVQIADFSSVWPSTAADTALASSAAAGRNA